MTVLEINDAYKYLKLVEKMEIRSEFILRHAEIERPNFRDFVRNLSFSVLFRLSLCRHPFNLAFKPILYVKFVVHICTG